MLNNIFNLKKSFELVQNPKGLHQLGGEKPADFHIPENEFLGGFQYLGFINNTDKVLSWLPFNLHLICPIFTDFDYLFLDYNNPHKPIIIYPHKSAEITSAYDELSKDSFVIYNEENFSLKPFKGINSDNEFDVVAIAGKPHWSGEVQVPKCPKTNTKMRFVCQLFSNGPITAKEKNFNGQNDYYESLFAELNFWGDGDLKIFFEPSSKIACYFIQNT